MPDDLALLDTLAVALAPETRQPSPAELVALRRVVDAEFRRSRVVWLRRPMATAAAVAIIAAAALAAGNTVLPRPARVVVRALDLPVDSVALVDAKDRLEDLQEAVDAGDPVAATAAVPPARSAVAKLDAAERRRVEPRASELLDRGDRLVGSTSTTAATAPAAAPATTTTSTTERRPTTTTTSTRSTTSTTVRTSNEGPGSVNSGDGGHDGSDTTTSQDDSGA